MTTLCNTLARVTPGIVVCWLIALDPVAVCAAAGQGVDPIEWNQPAQRPAFRSRLSGEEFTKRFESALDEIGSIDALVDSKLPPSGLRLTKVLPDSQAEALGLSVGDIVRRIDDQYLWTHYQSWPRTEEPQQLHYVSRNGEARSVRIQPGRVGVNGLGVWKPELLYIRGKGRSEKWDRDVLVGIVKRWTDPELAETCWRRAIDAGYRRDYLSAMCGAAIALEQGRAEAAADFAFFARNEDRDNGQLVHPVLLYRVAIANYKIKAALEIAQRDATAIEVNHASLEMMISLHDRRTAAQRSLPPPSRRVESWYRDDLVPRVVKIDGHNHIKQIRKRKIHLKTPSGSFTRILFGLRDPARDVEMRLRFTIKPTDGQTTAFGKIFQMSLVVRDPEKYRSDLGPSPNWGLGVELECPTTWHMRHSVQFSRFSHHDERLHTDGKTVHDYRFIRVGGQGEIFRDGRRVLYTPINEEINGFDFYLKAVGVDVHIQDLQLVELIEKP